MTNLISKGAVLVSFLFAFSVQAEKKTIEVEGMHCKGCVEMMEGEVCEAQKFKTCKVTLSKKKKNTGILELETEDGTPIDMAKIKEKVSEAGDQYKVVE